jgi:hypothetical protein
MRLYGGRVIKQNTERKVARAQELRNAVVVDVTPASRYCRVKIQGSSTLIKAWYPENWEATPFYLKRGSAVTVSSPGGSRGGRIEITGLGILLPTTTANEDITITPDPEVDCIVTGCTLRPSIPISTSLKLDTGTYRINGTTYTIVPMSMDRSDITMDRFDIIMDELGDSIPIDAASATKFRYDSITIGADGVIDVIKGSEFLASGTIPDPPEALAGHIRLGFVLIPPNATAINGGDINKTFTAPQPTSLSVSITDDELSWAELNTTISISVKDQYGNVAVTPSGGWMFTLAWTRGNGTLSYDGYSTDESASFTIRYTGATAAVVTYTRNQDAGDVSPLLTITEANALLGAITAHIQLLDVSGNKIP